MKEYKKMVKTMKGNISKKTNLKTVHKCSYFKCKNMESNPGEFQACSKCKIALYCSPKCFRKDWKQRHKKICRGLPC
jgi:hypothetical protein